MSFLLDRRKFLLGAAGAGLAAGGLISFPFGLAQAAETKPITDRKLKIALSNSFIGNKWRLTMENLFKSALQMEPYKSEVEGSWFNSGNDVSKQSQQIANLISQGVDAILVDAASPTGLNGILHQASQRGILVVSFDNTVTEPTGLKIGMDEFNFGVLWAEFVAKKIGHDLARTRYEVDRSPRRSGPEHEAPARNASAFAGPQQSRQISAAPAMGM